MNKRAIVCLLIIFGLLNYADCLKSEKKTKEFKE